MLLKNTKLLLSRILEHGSCKLYKISDNKNEYKRLKRTLSQQNALGNWGEALVNDTLMGETLNKLSQHNTVYLIHDPSDIRKPHSKKTETLGKVLDLNKKVINGYSTHNVVAVLPKDKSVHLVSHESYSNKDPRFLKEKWVKKFKEDKNFPEKETLSKLYHSHHWFNKKTISDASIKKISTAIKNRYPDMKITHILDREFDDETCFQCIEQLNDTFIIRAKKTRKDPESKKKIKLINSVFDQQKEIPLQQVRIKNKAYQDVICGIEWKKYKQYTAIRITLFDRQGKMIFPDPLLLLTNQAIQIAEDAYLAYQCYLKRSRIECVFKFLKEGLGWEEMQIQDFQGIKNLLSVCFFIAAYLYDINEAIVQDNYVILLAKLGGGKGMVSRHYILKGIHMMMSKYRVDRILEEENPSAETLKNAFAMAGIWDE